VELTWLRWFAGSSVPGLLTLVIVPWLLYRWTSDDSRHPAGTRAGARRTRAHGSLSREEKWLAVIMFGVMTGWVRSRARNLEHLCGAGRLSAILLRKFSHGMTAR
jgi:DASS family divalent anion:Na+ symporter